MVQIFAEHCSISPVIWTGAAGFGGGASTTGSGGGVSLIGSGGGGGATGSVGRNHWRFGHQHWAAGLGNSIGFCFLINFTSFGGVGFGGSGGGGSSFGGGGGLIKFTIKVNAS
ncbi:MAG: hypothetical protein V9G21_07965 [Methylotenera sp.]